MHCPIPSIFKFNTLFLTIFIPMAFDMHAMRAQLQTFLTKSAPRFVLFKGKYLSSKYTLFYLKTPP